MPQIEEVQSVYWGPLRPDPVDLAVDGINVATGPNGSGKTTFLDAIKLMLGVSDLGRKAPEYIYDGGGDSAKKADRAFIKVVFTNPERAGTRGRIFADYGRGCEASTHVTAICEVTRENRRYVLLPGYLGWGLNGRGLHDDILATIKTVPVSHWMGPRKWSDLLARAGVGRALLHVISLKQGETDKIIDGSAEIVLKRMLELTGRQSTLDEFRDAKARLIEVQSRHDEVSRRFEVEKRSLEALDLKAQRHREYLETLERIQQIERLELPAARRAEASERISAMQKERDGTAERIAKDREQLNALDRDIPNAQSALAELEKKVERLKASSAENQEEFRRRSSDEGAARDRLLRAESDADSARRTLGEEPSRDHLVQTETELRKAQGDRDALGTEEASLKNDLAELEAGRPPRPEGMDSFRGVLAEQGIESWLVAEHLEVPAGVPAEAALGEGVWALVVPAERLEEATELAMKEQYRLPLAASGHGAPRGALAGARGLEQALAYLEEVDLPMGSPGVSAEGLVRGKTWGAYRAPFRLVLGTKAREQAIDKAKARLTEVSSESARLDAFIEEAASRERVIRAGVEALEQLGAVKAQFDDAVREASRIARFTEEFQEEINALLPDIGRGQESLRSALATRVSLQKQLAEIEARLKTYDSDLTSMRQILAEMQMPQDGDLPSDLQPVPVLERELQSLLQHTDDESRFPEEVRSELILAQRDDQERTVEEVGMLLEGRAEDLRAVRVEVERAKQRYDEHIRQVVHLLARRFREICEQAGMDGDIELRPSEIEGEFGIDIRVAHSPGEPKRSYRSGAHSGGQRAKMSIMLLLAAMGLEGSGDIVVMDEHIAHLDSRNIDYVAEVMAALKDRVQFILATPTNAESARLGWCDHQIAFYPKENGQFFAPPIRLFTRKPRDDQRYAAMGQLSLAD